MALSTDSRCCRVIEIGDTTRAKTKIYLLTNPPKAKNPNKQQIFDIARSNYLRCVHLSPERPIWSTYKFDLVPRPSTFLDPTIPIPEIVIHDDYYDYSAKAGRYSEIWTVFAAASLGGGYKKTGWVQEEIITQEFFEMTYGIDKYEQLDESRMSLTESTIWIDLVRNSIANLAKYGGNNIRREGDDGTFDADKYLSPNPVTEHANFISIDAIRRKDRSLHYSNEEISKMLIKSISGFEASVNMGFDVINTGNWGAGAFNGTGSMALFVQVMAAWLTGATRVVYWGAKDIQSDDRENFDEVINVFNAWRNHRACTASDVFTNIVKILITPGSIPPRLADIVRPIISDVPSHPARLSQSSLLSHPTQQTYPTSDGKPIDPRSWYWLTNDNQWTEYNATIRDFLNNQLRRGYISESFAIGSDMYTIELTRNGWRQISSDRRKKRLVLVPESKRR